MLIEILNLPHGFFSMTFTHFYFLVRTTQAFPSTHPLRYATAVLNSISVQVFHNTCTIPTQTKFLWPGALLFEYLQLNFFVFAVFAKRKVMQSILQISS
mgnify:CR=1 FL=1